jgi:hypothetical protein
MLRVGPGEELRSDPAVGVASAVEYDGGMDENPYRSPSAATRIDDEPLLPFWRRVISLVLIIFGLMYGISGFAMLVGFVIWPERRQDVLQALAAFGLGVAMLWGGLRLRRRKRPISD